MMEILVYAKYPANSKIHGRSRMIKSASRAMLGL